MFFFGDSALEVQRNPGPQVSGASPQRAEDVTGL